MDAVTHTMMGAILASPWATSRPEAAACFVLGSILPDVDAVSRTFGKRAFLRFHQTYTHSIVAVVLAAVSSAALFAAIGHPDYFVLAGAVSTGMLLHILLDATNTYGITLAAPFSMRRYCTQWVFFIDLPVILASLAALTAIVVQWRQYQAINYWPAVSYGVFLTGYWLLRGLMLQRAWRAAPSKTVALIPSGIIPWRYFGCSRADGSAKLFLLNAITGAHVQQSEVTILDDQFADSLSTVPEFRLMRELSNAYHIVKQDQQTEHLKLTCRDLRIRNFNTTFGELEIEQFPDGQIGQVVFHV